MPFRGDSEWEVLRKHETAEPDYPTTMLAPHRSVIARCLAKSPSDRFASVRDLLTALTGEVVVPVAEAGVPPVAPAAAATNVDPYEGLRRAARDFSEEAMKSARDAGSRAMSDVQRAARRGFANFREDWRGHLWQARFGSSVLDERYLMATVRYIERNPVRAGIVRLPWHYRWSSARWHMGEVASDSLVRGDEPLRGMISDWREYLNGEEDRGVTDTIRRETQVSRPLGNEGFVRTLERRLRRPLTRSQPGRPRKK